MLESILERVQTVTRCHSVGITLRDADAPGRGRIYLAANGLTGLPVSRVALDDDMVDDARHRSRTASRSRAAKSARHSFLRPLHEIGSEFFWVWPVMPGERVEAILAVGYREAPARDPQVASCGGQFARRLAIALSKTARDERLHRQAHYDPLTALPNRLLFLDRLNQELASATAGLSRGALLYIDLDHFKRVNDSVGHAAGDQLLTIVAQRLRSCVKDGDTVARLGGDEFTVILRNVADPDAARSVADRIIESLQLPVNIGGRDHYVCASIGITLFPDDGMTIEELMRNADTAMYRAKDLGRGRAMFFDLNMTGKPAAPTETGLHRALRRREFSLFYQPQFSVADGSLMGLEALLRWQTPRDGVRYPGEFVPAAEESGLIVDIGGWVLETACAQLAEWRDQDIAPPRLALNVSAQQLKHAEFPKVGAARARQVRHLPPELLELELTESVFADEAAGAALVRLAQIGVHLALDDFGTGYSSLNYLRQYPIGTVKIDRTFLEEVPQNPASATLVETIVVMAHALGKRVVAEGIEAVEQLEFLRERRCDVAQGFYLARPLATTRRDRTAPGPHNRCTGRPARSARRAEHGPACMEAPPPASVGCAMNLRTDTRRLSHRLRRRRAARVCRARPAPAGPQNVNPSAILRPSSTRTPATDSCAIAAGLIGTSHTSTAAMIRARLRLQRPRVLQLRSARHRGAAHGRGPAARGARRGARGANPRRPRIFQDFRAPRGSRGHLRGRREIHSCAALGHGRLVRVSRRSLLSRAFRERRAAASDVCAYVLGAIASRYGQSISKFTSSG